MPQRKQPISTAARVRSELFERMPVVTTVWSVSGSDIGFFTDFGNTFQVGGFAIVTTPEGARLLVQIHDLHITEREGIRVDVAVDELGPASSSVLRSANVGVNIRHLAGAGLVLAEITPEGLRPAPKAGFDEGLIEPVEADRATAGVVTQFLHDGLGSSVGLAVGRMGGMQASAALRASGFSRHTFMVGQSGSGKTYSLGLLLERLLVSPTLPMVIIDPNSDHIHLGRLRPRVQIAPRGGKPMAPAAYNELKVKMAAAGEVAVAQAGSATLPLRIHLSDLSLVEQALTLGLSPLRDGDEYGALIDVLDELQALPRYGFDRVTELLAGRTDDASVRLTRRIDNLRIAQWSVWAHTEEPSLIERLTGKRVTVLDTGSLGDARERSVVALAAMGVLHRRAQRSPVLLVVDEAHNVLAPNADTELQQAVTDHGVWIAGEGRKYGVHLLVSTQRPQKIHRNVISQCDNLVLMHMNSQADVAEIAAIFSHVPASMIAAATSFEQGEMLVGGPIATPAIRVRTGERWCPEGGADLPTTWANGTR